MAGDDHQVHFLNGVDDRRQPSGRQSRSVHVSVHRLPGQRLSAIPIHTGHRKELPQLREIARHRMARSPSRGARQEQASPKKGLPLKSRMARRSYSRAVRISSEPFSEAKSELISTSRIIIASTFGTDVHQHARCHMKILSYSDL